ncbi:hypothetical protein LZ30DRAFT_718408 [Colletotrichum cereale]|nr:hypothetical protein LZ30DRAFT_718408 [Colletotrichum cereale]
MFEQMIHERAILGNEIRALKSIGSWNLLPAVLNVQDISNSLPGFGDHSRSIGAAHSLHC